VIEDQVELDSNKFFKDAYDQLVIIIHPMFSTAESDDKKAAAASDVKKATSETIVDSSSTRPPTEVLPTSPVKAEAITEIAKDHSPNEEEVAKYLEDEEVDYDELPPLEEMTIDKADL